MTTAVPEVKPPVAKLGPEPEQYVEFVELQVSVVLWPCVIDAGLALMLAVGAGAGAGFTVTLTVEVSEPASFVHVTE